MLQKNPEMKRNGRDESLGQTASPLTVHPFSSASDVNLKGREGNRSLPPNALPGWEVDSSLALQGFFPSPQGWVDQGKDVAASVLAKDKSRYEEMRFRAFVEHSSDIIVMINLEGVITYINPAVEKVLGFKPEERIGAGGFELVHPEDITFLADSFRTLASNPKAPPIFGEMRLQHKDGSYRIFEGVGSGFVINAVVEAVIVNYRDITQRRKMENDLRASERNFRCSLDDSPLGIRISNIDGETIYANRAILEMYGYDSIDELKNTPLPERYTPESYAKWRTRMEKRRQGAFGPSEYEISILRKNGEVRHLHVFRKEIFWNGQKQFQVIYNDVTLHRQAEEKIHQSEEKYRTIIEQMEEGYFEIDLAGNFTFTNDAENKMLDYSRDELIGMNYRQFMDKTHAQQAYQIFHHVFKTGEPMQSAYGEVIRKNGMKGFYEISISLIRNTEGRPVGFRGVSRDITERRQAEEKLRMQEQLFRTLAEQSSDIIVLVDKRGSIVYQSPALEDFLGYKPKDRIGLNAFQEIHPDDLNKILYYFNILINKSNASYQQTDVRIRHKNGGFREFEILAKGISKNDIVEKVVANLRDVTERKQAVEALRASEELYTQLVNTIPDVVIRTDLAGKITFANDYTIQRGGYRWDEIEGHNIIEFIPEEERARAVQNIMRIITEGRQGPYEYHIILKNGVKIPFEVSSGIFRGEDELPFGLVHVCRDIRIRKKDEKEKEQLQERLNQAQKMESVGRLAGGVAHDFNNMLGVILGHTELAMERKVPDSRLQIHLQEIRKAAERSASLTRQLLAFARKQTVSPKIIDINDAVTGMIKMLQRLIGEDIALTWLPGMNIWPIRIDPSQVDQILANLCVNSRDAISGVGKVSIESGNITVDEAFCTGHADFVPGDYVFLSISDDGCGMDKETRGKLFEPFFTTKDLGKGTGLGLAIIYGIVRQNKGFISVYSEPGQGSTFSIFLPRHIGHAEGTEKDEAKESVVGGRETILLVEDERAILDLSKLMLEQQGYRVLSAATPVEALDLARQHQGDIHLLMTDVVMPEMNGRDLAREMLSLYPGIRRLFMSGYTADMIAHHGVLDEGSCFIQKPFTRYDLTAKVREALYTSS